MIRGTVKKGFTLVELMVVIGIIAILMAILIPRLLYVKYQGQLSACIFNERSLASALENYRTDYGGKYPDNLQPVIDLRYIGVDPRCPTTNQPYTYETNDEHNNYTVSCDGWHYKVLNQMTQGYPQYNPAIGLLIKPLPTP